MPGMGKLNDGGGHIFFLSVTGDYTPNQTYHQIVILHKKKICAYACFYSTTVQESILIQHLNFQD